MKRQTYVFSGTTKFVARTGSSLVAREYGQNTLKPMLKMTTTIPADKTKGHESFVLGYN